MSSTKFAKKSYRVLIVCEKTLEAGNLLEASLHAYDQTGNRKAVRGENDKTTWAGGVITHDVPRVR
jgi:hypothetical protein